MDTSGGEAEVDLGQKKKKLTWYKADVEPSVGTSLFFEVPVDPLNTAISAPQKDKDTKLMLLRKRSKDRGARTLVINPGEQRLTKALSRGLEGPEFERNNSFGPPSSINTSKHTL